jgi:hypothetical protein
LSRTHFPTIIRQDVSADLGWQAAPFQHTLNGGCNACGEYQGMSLCIRDPARRDQDLDEAEIDSVFIIAIQFRAAAGPQGIQEAYADRLGRPNRKRPLQTDRSCCIRYFIWHFRRLLTDHMMDKRLSGAPTCLWPNVFMAELKYRLRQGLAAWVT